MGVGCIGFETAGKEIQVDVKQQINKRSNLFKGIQSRAQGQFRNAWVRLTDDMFYRGEWKLTNLHGRGLIYIKSKKQLIASCFQNNRILNIDCRKISIAKYQYYGRINSNYEMHGIGKLTGINYTYNGEFKNDKLHGFGQLKQKDCIFKGIFYQGFKVNGLQTTPDGQYQGPFVGNKREGKGIFRWKNGGVYEGNFNDGMMDGQCILYDTQGNYSGKHIFIQNKFVS